MGNKYLLNEAARIIGVRGYRIAYAITQGHIESPRETINRQRIFTDEDISRIKKYFENRTNRKGSKESLESK